MTLMLMCRFSIADHRFFLWTFGNQTLRTLHNNEGKTHARKQDRDVSQQRQEETDDINDTPASQVFVLCCNNALSLGGRDVISRQPRLASVEASLRPLEPLRPGFLGGRSRCRRDDAGHDEGSEMVEGKVRT